LTHLQGPGSEVIFTHISLTLGLERNRVESRVHRLKRPHHRYQRVVQMICSRIGVAQEFTRARTRAAGSSRQCESSVDSARKSTGGAGERRLLTELLFAPRRTGRCAARIDHLMELL
jgi:hypothetical protein